MLMRSGSARALAVLGLAVTLLAIGVAGGRTSAYPGKNGKILFLSDRGSAGMFDVYTINADGSA
jgi:hypothetical protein